MDTLPEGGMTLAPSAALQEWAERRTLYDEATGVHISTPITRDVWMRLLREEGRTHDLARMEAAQAKRERKAEKRARDAADFIPSPGYAEMPDWVPR